MDIEMSLDDIIQKKGIKLNRGPRTGRFRGGRQRFKRNENNNTRSNSKAIVTKSRGGGSGLKSGVKGTGGGGNAGSARRLGPSVRDARLKIIQKTRSKITDAREKLAELAKQTDARLKIKKMHEKRFKIGGPKQSVELRRAGVKVPFILRSINPSITINNDSDEEMLQVAGAAPLLQRTIINKRNSLSMSRLGVLCNASDINAVGGGDNTSNNMLTDNVNDKMYSSNWPVLRSMASRLQQPPSQLKIVAHNEQISQSRMQIDNWDYQVPAAAVLNRQQALKRPFVGINRGYSEDEDLLSSHRSSRISQEMKARLDTPAVPISRSMGVLSQPSLSASQPVGHRIVVSNLQTSVTHEDIKELFEDIGPLVTSHVVRPGTAEVIYVHQKDAIAAVDAYHNRQLDGQPMKCLLVNSRPSNLTSNARTGAKYPSSTKSAVLPDISAIHKALFNK